MTRRGVCHFCGLALTGKRTTCHSCDEIVRPGKRRYPRARTASALIGLRGFHPGADLLVGFTWWHQTPDAKPSLERWAYIDWPTLCARARQAFPPGAFADDPEETTHDPD